MKELNNLKDLDCLKKEDFSVLMVYAEGCEACAKAKPEFEKLDKNFEYDFYQIPLNQESMEFYKKYEEQVKIPVPAVDEDGDPIVDAEGKQMTRNEMRYQVVVPKFYVFHGSESSEEDEYGLLGKVDGFNVEQLGAILEQMKDLEVDNG